MEMLGFNRIEKQSCTGCAEGDCATSTQYSIRKGTTTYLLRKSIGDDRSAFDFAEIGVAHVQPKGDQLR